MKKSHAKPTGLKAALALAYALAALLWLAMGAVRCGAVLFHKAEGTMPQKTLTEQELSFESFVNYSQLEWNAPPTDAPNWYLSTDNDPKIFWSGSAYLETVRLDAKHHLPAGSVVLYYLLPGQTDYRETQKIYAEVTAPGQYTFDLGGKTVAGLRIDPDSMGGIATLFSGVELNPPILWYWRFVPTGGQWCLLLGLPALAAAFWQVLTAAVPFKNHREQVD